MHKVQKKFLEFFAYTKYDSINLELLMEKYFHNFLLFFIYESIFNFQKQIIHVDSNWKSFLDVLK